MYRLRPMSSLRQKGRGEGGGALNVALVCEGSLNQAATYFLIAEILLG